MQSTTLADGTAALAGRRIALWGLVAAKVLAGWGARIGFAVLQPVSVIEEEIAKDPTSPIAVANAIARKNGEAPGARSGLFRGLSLIPVAARSSRRSSMGSPCWRPPAGVSLGRPRSRRWLLTPERR
jgi:hypothetical protein